jgi:dienelactone hydrolase
MHLSGLRRTTVVLAVCCAMIALTREAIGAALQPVEFASAAQLPALPRVQDQVAKEVQGDVLRGELARPDGDGPHPAVVVLHGCGGSDPTRNRSIAEAVVSWGYAALFVDSFATRRILHTCTPETFTAEANTVLKRPFDAFGALRFLARQPFIDTRRVAVIGLSQGAEIALTIGGALSLEEFIRASDVVFRAAVAFYPPCRRAGERPSIPTLILVGALDDWTPAEDCGLLLGRWGDVSVSVKLEVHPGAFHAFNSSYFNPGKSMFGHWLEYNPEATGNAYRAMKDFLERHMR